MSRAEDLRGRKFGKLTVFRRSGSSSDGSARWLCRCVCGNTRIALHRSLRMGRVNACKECREIQGGWTAEQESRLRALYPTTDTREFARMFGRTAKAIASRAKVLKVVKAVGHHGKTEWTPARIRALKRFYPDTHTDELAERLGVSVLALYQRAQKLGIRKSAAYVERKKADEAIRLTRSGVRSRFQKGLVPHNKGTRRPGWHAGRMRETQFRKGQQPQNTMPLWSFRWVRCGSGNGRGDGTAYMMLKTGKPGPAPFSGWEWVHKLIWQNAHGPIPPGHRLWWKDGDHANNSLANLELLSDRDHMMRTTVHNLPAPLPQLIQLAGALKRKIRNKEKSLNGQEHIAGSAGPSLRDAGSAV